MAGETRLAVSDISASNLLDLWICADITHLVLCNAEICAENLFFSVFRGVRHQLPEQHGLRLQHRKQWPLLPLLQWPRLHLFSNICICGWMHLCKGDVFGWRRKMCCTSELLLLLQRPGDPSWGGHQQGQGHVVRSYFFFFPNFTQHVSCALLSFLFQGNE